jgi:hypothetical protein
VFPVGTSELQLGEEVSIGKNVAKYASIQSILLSKGYFSTKD